MLENKTNLDDRLIRVAIFADTLSRAQSLATLLAEDERLEIFDTRTWARSVRATQVRTADVILAVGIRFDEQSAEGSAVVLVSDERPEQRAFTGAIRAWLPEHSSPAEIAAAIVAAAQDLTVVTQQQARQWLNIADTIQEGEAPFVEALTSREQQVLRMMADGFGNKEIAGRLGISHHTAKFHVAQILGKLGASSRAEAVGIGIRRGLIPI